MYASDNAREREQVERDPRNDPRRSHDEEIVVDRPSIVADRSREDAEWPSVPFERRKTERRRIERMGTDI